jgi:Ser/Thr protein kinase RdoA (MazF antagonist)
MWSSNPTCADGLKLVLAAYPQDCGPRRVESLGSSGGFSGAQFWRLETARGLLCLRRWPAEHPNRERLRWIHSVLDHVSSRGFDAVPVPIRTATGESSCSFEDHLWELTEWLPGAADYLHAPTPEKLEAAMAALARWHAAAASFPRGVAAEGESLGIKSRLEQLKKLQADGVAKLSIDVEIKAVEEPEWSELAALANRLIAGFVRVAPAVDCKLLSALSTQVPLQPCIRDIWSDHVLFEGNRVSGIIDFGAMRVETVAGDVARLLGSLAGDDLLAWQHGLEAYQAVHPLSDDESALVPVFDESTILLAGFNWLEWLVSGRRFENPGEVLRRLRMIVNRLEVLSNTVARRA